MTLLCLLELVQGQQTLHQNTMNDCEVMLPGGTITYEVCHSANLFLLHNGAFNWTMTPEDSTCGEQQAEEYCTPSPVNCYECDARNPATAHPLSYIHDLVTNTASGTVANLNTAWQSRTMFSRWTTDGSPAGTPSLVIDLTFSFGHQYILQDDLVLTFQSGRPKQMMIEKSVDFGVTWEPLQYYHSDCQDLWQDPNVHQRASIARGPAISNVICSTAYSMETPYSRGEVKFAVMDDRYRPYLGTDMEDYESLYTHGLENGLTQFLIFTDIRIKLQKPAASGFEMTGERYQMIQYYYAISDISISAGCFCNLHGRYCQSGSDGTVSCVCTHHTEGVNCERCLPLYNNKPWKAGSYLPYPAGTANQCEACECNGHALSCTYASTARGGLGGGICNDCQHNTEGDSCERCVTGHYTDVSLPSNHPNICIACGCEPLGVQNPNDLSCSGSHGQCSCKSLVTGTHCDVCETGYFGLLLQDDQPGVCKRCTCNILGSISPVQTICDAVSGQCPCKDRVAGRSCDRCLEGAYSFPSEETNDCIECGCDTGGATSHVCHETTGDCSCKPGITLRRCNSAEPGFYAAALDAHSSQPIGGQCQPDTATVSEADTLYFTGRMFMNCRENNRVLFENIDGSEMQTKLSMHYYPVLRYSLQGPLAWEHLTLTITVLGNSGVNMSPYLALDPTVPSGCPESRDEEQIFDVSTLPPGAGVGHVFGRNLTLDARCSYSVSLLVGTSGGATVPIVIDSVSFFPNYEESRIHLQADSSRQAEHELCYSQIAGLSTHDVAMLRPECREFVFSIGTEWHLGALECHCNADGTAEDTECFGLGGKCTCKSGVGGRDCERCLAGFYNFTSTGCEQCPTIPCPGEFDDFIAEGGGGSDEGSSSTVVIIIIVVLLIILIAIIVFIVILIRSPELREKVFKTSENDDGTKIIGSAGGSLPTPSSPTSTSKGVFNNYTDRAEDSPPRHKRKLSDEVVQIEADPDTTRLIEEDSRRSSSAFTSSSYTTSSPSNNSQQFDNPVYTMTHGDEANLGYSNAILDNIISREKGELRPRMKSRDGDRTGQIKPGGPIAEFKPQERGDRPHRRHKRSKEHRSRSKEHPRPKSSQYDSFTSTESLALDSRKLRKFAGFGQFDEDNGSLV